MKKVLVFGGAGLVGSKFIELFNKNFEIFAPTASEVDILNQNQLERVLSEKKPDWIINFAAITDVEGSEKEVGNQVGICYQVNAIGAKNVAQLCQKGAKKLIHISTEYVFDGSKEGAPYTEEDKTNPINWYGKSKLKGEEYVLESGAKAVIVRISMPFSPFYRQRKDVARFFLEQLKMDKQIRAIEDQRITPTLVSDIANALKTFIDADIFSGIYHVSSTDSVSPLEFAKTIAELFNLDYAKIASITLDEFNKTKKAKLLRYSWLNPAKFDKQFGEGILHTVEEGLAIFKEEIDRVN